MNKQRVKQRQANFELLRILAMTMVVALHFFSKGNLLTNLGDEFSEISYMVWFLEAFAIVAVNVYVLLTGYFMCKAKFQCNKVITIIAQTLFYTTLVPICLMLIGVIEPMEFGVYSMLQALLPIHMQQYWFISTYVLLLLLSPILNKAITSFDQKQLGSITILLILYESIVKSVLPFKITSDVFGYGILWFIVLYLTAAYIRLYGIPWFSSFRKSFLIYVVSVVFIYGIMLLLRYIYITFDMLGDSVGFSYHYNFIVVYVASIACFYMFYYMKIKEGTFANVIRKISPYVLGVYLFHEQIQIRYVWPSWIGISHATSIVGVLIIMIWAITAIMLLGIAIDYVRGLIFSILGKWLNDTIIPKKIKDIDDLINGI